MLNLLISDYAMKQQSNAAVEAKTVIRLQQQSVSQVDISQAAITASAKQYQGISQATSGKCEVSNDDEEMMMVLLLLNEIDS